MSAQTLPQAEMLAAVEAYMQQVVARVRQDGPGSYDELYHWLAYHLGWEGEGAGPAAQGKRIRPLLVLLTAEAAGGAWQTAVPAAAAVELIHNFSLIHDDIEDNSPLRRGRPTVWQRWGVAQAINTGDALFSLAHLAVLELHSLTAAQVLQHTCLRLTQGQYLDIAYETRLDLSQADYWPMIAGKTAALAEACLRLGALAAGASPERQAAFARFGHLLGLAYQVQDDLLGVWGDPEQTGKSAASDLVSGKKSLPVLYGLAQSGAFARRWRQGPIDAADAPAAAALLEADGARRYVQDQAERLTAEALSALAQAQPAGQAGAQLTALAQQLLGRRI